MKRAGSLREGRVAIKRVVVWPEITHSNVGGKRWIICQHTGAWQPPTDVYENDDGVVVRVEVAGMRSEDLSISLEGRMMVVTGTRVDPAPKRTYHQMEIRFGEFCVEIYLPWQVEPGEVEASYKEGFLEVCLPGPRSQRVEVAEVGREEG